MLLLALLLPAAHADAVLLDGAAVVPTLAQDIAVEVRGQVAVTTVTTRFDARSTPGLTYAFGLPADAMATDLVLVVDGVALPATLSAGPDAELPDMDPERADALGRYLGANPLSVAIRTVPPDATLEVRLEYVALLPYALGDVAWVYPSAPFEEQAPVARTLTLDLDPGRRIDAVWADGMDVALDDEHAVVTASGPADRALPLEVAWTLSSDDVGVQVYAYRPHENPFVDEDAGYFVLIVEPPREAPSTDKYFTYVLDRSCSMDGEKMDAAREGAHAAIASLRADDTFNLVAFDSDVELFRSRAASATDARRAEAHAFVDGLSVGGGTNIHDALLAALDAPPAAAHDGEPPTGGCAGWSMGRAAPRARRDPDRPQVVLFLTDGRGNDAAATTLDAVAAANDHDAAIWSVAIGGDADLPFLQALSQRHRGQVAHLVDPDTLQADIEALVWTLENPVLLRPSVAFDGGGTHDVLPGELPDLFLGNQLVIVGRYDAPGPVDVHLTGTVDGHERSWTFATELPERASEDPFVARVWARVTVDHLLARIAEEGATDELVDAITELGLAYRLDTPYTRFGFGGGGIGGSPTAFTSDGATCGCSGLGGGRLPPMLFAVGLLALRRRRP